MCPTFCRATCAPATVGRAHGCPDRHRGAIVDVADAGLGATQRRLVGLRYRSAALSGLVDPAAAGTRLDRAGQPPEREQPAAGTPPPSGSGWGQPPPAAPGATGWGWARPERGQAGVIPLRPLGVGEILDGAVTTIRRNPGPMLGLSAIVAVLTQLLGLGVGYLLLRGAPAIESLEPTASPGDVSSRQWPACSGRRRSWSSSPGWRRWSSPHPLTVVVSRAVLGERMTAGQAWQAAAAPAAAVVADAGLQPHLALAVPGRDRHRDRPRCRWCRRRRGRSDSDPARTGCRSDGDLAVRAVRALGPVPHAGVDVRHARWPSRPVGVAGSPAARPSS